MKSNIEIIAYSLFAALKDILKSSDEEIKGESFKLTFDLNTYSIIFLCSLHHLDMPWKINMIIEEKNKSSQHIPNKKNLKEYEITPIFLSNVNVNAQALAETIKVDVIDLIKELRIV